MLRTTLFVIAAIGLVACGDSGTGTEQDLPLGDQNPAWSPNGSEIAVLSSYPDGLHFDIHVIDTLGNAVRLTNGLNAGSPSWSPDGLRIAFIGGSSTRGLYVVNRDGSGLTQLLARPVGSGGFVAWSPDGETIAFFNGRGIDLFDIATSVVTSLTGQGIALAWSPDGSQAVIVRKSVARTGSLVRMEADGSGVVTLRAGFENSSGAAAWSPCPEITWVDSEIESINPFDIERQSFVYVMDSDGSNLRKFPVPLGGSGASSWSPDCSKIAFAPHGQIQIINADGSGLRTLIRR